MVKNRRNRSKTYFTDNGGLRARRCLNQLTHLPSTFARFISRPLLATLVAAWGHFEKMVGFFVPESCRREPDEARRARLVAHFGLQGTIFGAFYAIFYFLIDHIQGSAVIIICSAVFASVPWILRRTANYRLGAQMLIGTMTSGFAILTLIEGGIHSHAVAWLASVPMCALLILGVRPAIQWVGVCFAIGIAFGVAAVMGVELAPAYDQKWHTIIDFAGNVGIILFLFVLGLVFETSRAQAFDHMQASLDLLVDSNEQLTHLNNEKTEFLDIAAHDLRNPLSAIIGFADLLQIEQSPKTQQRAATIARAGRRMLELITDLLDANAIESGRYASEVEPLELRALVLASMQQNITASERKKIPLEFVDGPSCWAQGDRKATLQILDNLISNALKYSPVESRVTLTLVATDEHVDFSIRDQGPGISAEDQTKLFQKHTKLTARPTGGESSVGLGLSIVKRLAEAMGGSIQCRSALGEGSTFVFRLRAVAPEVISMHGSRQPVAESPGAGLMTG